jgi:hypothetical protein
MSVRTRESRSRCRCLGRIAFVALALVAASALATAPARAQSRDKITGLTTEITGPISGRVSELDGTPVADREVFIASEAGQQVVRTDAQGRFRIDLKDTKGSKTVFVQGTLRLTLEKLQESTYEGETAVEIQESELPKVMPKLKSDGLRILPYSAKARAADTWIRAWLILDVTASGEVRRVKLLNPPGHDLDTVAVRAAFDLRFEPARDAAGRAVDAAVLWTFDWPAYQWMIEHRFSLEWMPPEATALACRGDDVLRGAYRECPPPAVARAHALPWLSRPSDEPPAATTMQQRQQRRWYESKTGWVLSGTGLAMVGAAVYLLVNARQLQREADMATDTRQRLVKSDSADARRLGGYLLGGVGLVVGGVGITTFVLHSGDDRGAALVLSGSF